MQAYSITNLWLCSKWTEVPNSQLKIFVSGRSKNFAVLQIPYFILDLSISRDCFPVLKPTFNLSIDMYMCVCCRNCKKRACANRAIVLRIIRHISEAHWGNKWFFKFYRHFNSLQRFHVSVIPLKKVSSLFWM